MMPGGCRGVDASLACYIPALVTSDTTSNAIDLRLMHGWLFRMHEAKSRWKPSAGKAHQPSPSLRKTRKRPFFSVIHPVSTALIDVSSQFISTLRTVLLSRHLGTARSKIAYELGQITNIISDNGDPYIDSSYVVKCACEIFMVIERYSTVRQDTFLSFLPINHTMTLPRHCSRMFWSVTMSTNILWSCEVERNNL